MELLELPVSIGEALDKLTILDIKIENIKNESKLKDCQKEQQALYTKLEPYVKKFSFWYKALKAVNAEIWRLQDILRGSEDFLKLANYVLDLNDIRFRIKNKINIYSSSFLKEQKGYKSKNILLAKPLTLQQAFQYRKYLYYLSIDYDNVYICLKDASQQDLFQENIYLLKEEDIESYKTTCKVYEKDLSSEIEKELDFCKPVLDILEPILGLFLFEFYENITLLKETLQSISQFVDELYVTCYVKHYSIMKKFFSENHKIKLLTIQEDEEAWNREEQTLGTITRSIHTFFSSKFKGTVYEDELHITNYTYKNNQEEPLTEEQAKLQENIYKVLEKHSISVKRDNLLRGTATGIGDIAFYIRSLKLGLVSGPIYFNVNVRSLFLIYKDPANALEFRIAYYKQLLEDNDLPQDTIQYIYSSELEPEQHFDRNRMTFTPLSFSVPPIPAELQDKKYIVIHTKCRHTKKLNYAMLKECIKEFSSKVEISIPIVLMGERTFPKNFEHEVHGITTVYNELQGLKEKNKVFDYTKEEIFDSLNFEEYKKDLAIMRGAQLNIHFGLGGSFSTCMNFCRNTISYIPLSDEVVFNQELLLKDKIYVYENLTDYFVGMYTLIQEVETST